MLDPSVDGRDQPHRPEPSQEQSQGVALVVMSMPDCHLLAPANLKELGNHPPVERSAIRDRDQGGIPGFCLPDQGFKPRIVWRMQIGAEISIPHRLKEPRRVEDGLVGTAPGAADDTCVQDDGEL